jgi:hypothetical protein
MMVTTGGRSHLAQLHQLLDDLGNGDAERFRDLFDGGAGLDREHLRLDDDVRRRRRRLLERGQPPAAATPPGRLLRRRWALRAPRSLGVDDNATASTGASGTATAAAGLAASAAPSVGARRP